MTRTILAVAAVLAVGCSGGSDKPDRAAWLYGERAPDAAQVNTACPTPVHIERPYTFDGTYLDTHATCPPDVAAWWTGDVMHCEWRCVSYGCAAGQDVRIDYAEDSSVIAIVSGPSAYCN